MISDDSRRQRELEHWRQWQDRVDKIWGWQTPAGQVRSARRAQYFRELGRITREASVLEIGCGTGEFTRQLAPHAGELLAIDLSPELLQKAAANVHAACPDARVSFEAHDAMNLQLAADRFDAVFGCSVLHHLDAVAALREVRRVLKPGGWCVFSEPNMLNPQIALQKNIPSIKRRLGDSPDETAFFSWQLRRWLSELGYSQVYLRPFDFLHPVTPARWIATVDKLGRWLEQIPGVNAIAGSLIIAAHKPG